MSKRNMNGLRSVAALMLALATLLSSGGLSFAAPGDPSGVKGADPTAKPAHISIARPRSVAVHDSDAPDPSRTPKPAAPRPTRPGATLTVDASNCASPPSYCTIQDAINAAANGDTINVVAGTYIENVVVTKQVTITGAGAASTFIKPAVSNPNCGGAGGGSLCPGGSNIFLIQADNVTISGLTLDGDNPALTGGVNFGGANIDARNGIITNHISGVYNNLVVFNTTIKNIYLRGIYASTGGTFNFHDNTVQNVQADPG